MEHSTHARVWTDDELLALPKDGHRFELIAGVLHDMSPGGALHGAVSIRIASLLWQHVEQNGLGIVYDGQTGYRLDQATCVSPDVSFVCRPRLAELLPDPQKFLRGAPDLAVEVLSPSDSAGETDEKIQLYFRFGTRLLWVVDPQLELVRVYESPARFKVVERTGHLDGGGVLPDFSAAASRIFPGG